MSRKYKNNTLFDVKVMTYKQNMKSLFVLTIKFNEKKKLKFKNLQFVYKMVKISILKYLFKNFFY